MLSLPKVLPFIPYIILVCAAATIPQLSSILDRASNDTTASNLGVKFATRQLVEHDNLMRIFYFEMEPLPNPLYRHVLITAHRQIVVVRNAVGDEAIVRVPLGVRSGNVLFTAAADRHSAAVELTWGMLEEAVVVLEDFMLSRPFSLLVKIWEGLDGRGVPLGEMAIATFGNSNLTQVGKVQTS